MCKKGITSVNYHCLLTFSENKVRYVKVKNQSKNILFRKRKNFTWTEKNIINSFTNNVFPIENSTPDPILNETEFYTTKQTGARSKIPKIEIFPFRGNEILLMKLEMMKKI